MPAEPLNADEIAGLSTWIDEHADEDHCCLDWAMVRGLLATIEARDAQLATQTMELPETVIELEQERKRLRVALEQIRDISDGKTGDLLHCYYIAARALEDTK